MQKREWLCLKKLTDEDDFREVLAVGDKFLYGPKLCDQTPENDDNIWYFEVTRVSETVEYMPCIDKLEKDREIETKLNLEEE